MRIWISLVNLFLRRAWTGRFRRPPCAHITEVQPATPTTDVCEECVALGDTWPALRLCMQAGDIVLQALFGTVDLIADELAQVVEPVLITPLQITVVEDQHVVPSHLHDTYLASSPRVDRLVPALRFLASSGS